MILRSWNSEKFATWFSENEGGGQRPFGTFPKIHPFWRCGASLSEEINGRCTTQRMSILLLALVTVDRWFGGTRVQVEGFSSEWGFFLKEKHIPRRGTAGCDWFWSLPYWPCLFNRWPLPSELKSLKPTVNIIILSNLTHPVWTASKTCSELMTASADGLVRWWDTRWQSLPIFLDLVDHSLNLCHIFICPVVGLQDTRRDNFCLRCFENHFW